MFKIFKGLAAFALLLLCASCVTTSGNNGGTGSGAIYDVKLSKLGCLAETIVIGSYDPAIGQYQVVKTVSTIDGFLTGRRPTMTPLPPGRYAILQYTCSINKKHYVLLNGPRIPHGRSIWSKMANEPATNIGADGKPRETPTYVGALATFEVRPEQYTNIGKVRSIDTTPSTGWFTIDPGFGKLRITDLDPGALDAFVARYPALRGRVVTILMQEGHIGTPGVAADQPVRTPTAEASAKARAEAAR